MNVWLGYIHKKKPRLHFGESFTLKEQFAQKFVRISHRVLRAGMKSGEVSFLERHSETRLQHSPLLEAPRSQMIWKMKFTRQLQTSCTLSLSAEQLQWRFQTDKVQMNNVFKFSLGSWITLDETFYVFLTFLCLKSTSGVEQNAVCEKFLWTAKLLLTFQRHDESK